MYKHKHKQSQEDIDITVWTDVQFKISAKLSKH